MGKETFKICLLGSRQGPSCPSLRRASQVPTKSAHVTWLSLGVQEPGAGNEVRQKGWDRVSNGLPAMLESSQDL